MAEANIYAIYSILGGLIGSILTVIISKILEMIQQSKEHKNSISKTFFTKKLEVAEATVSQWYVSANLIGAMARLYEQAPVLEKGIEKDVFNILNKSWTTQLNKLQETSNKIANSFLLYFDIDDSIWNNEGMNNFIKSLSSLKVILTSLDFFHKLNETLPESEYKYSVQNEIDRLKSELDKEMNNFVSFLNDTRNAMIELLKIVRFEMKSYE